MNRRLMETIVKHKKSLRAGQYIDAYNRTVKDKICGTITIGVSFRNESFVVVTNESVDKTSNKIWVDRNDRTSRDS